VLAGCDPVSGRPVERDAAIAEGDPGVVTDDEVIEEVDVEQSPCGERFCRQVEVVR
jgi:hypothetical protein